MFLYKISACSKAVIFMAGIAASSRFQNSLKRIWKPFQIRAKQLSLSLSLPVLLAASADQKGQFMAEPITDKAQLYTNEDMKARMELLILRIQKVFCEALEAEETSGRKFTVDRWRRRNEKEGGGITCVLEGGEVLERAGVNITVMRAPLSPKLQESMRARGKTLPKDRKFEFFAAGVSSVIHPCNPHVPTLHFNFRYFEVQDEYGQNRHSWFGGGTDLTPYYLQRKDVEHFHFTLKKACDLHGPQRYPLYKQACDDYFLNTARGERRGVGGIFFDDLESANPMKEFNFVKDCAEAVVPCYIPIVRRRKNVPFTEAQRDWQLLRRGRYVEFNLVYDRGTKFGFATPGARIESVLVSLPLLAKWQYSHSPKEGSPEYKLMDVLKNPQDWV